MKKNLTRRHFLVQGSKAGVSCCLIMYGSNLLAMPVSMGFKPDLKKLTYCGYKCNPECTLFKGTIYNDETLKRKAYDEWEIKEKHGVEFDPEVIFCHGCKDEEQSKGLIVRECTVRACNIEKGHECCVQCKELVDCENELWMAFPQFREKVLEMQKKYFTS